MTDQTATKAFCILYNPLSSTGKGENRAHKLDQILKGYSVEYRSLLDIPDKRAFLRELDPHVTPVITGGDGTLSFFVNELGGENPTRDIYYFPAGTGNDFLNDLNKTGDTEPFLLNPYITDLPVIRFNGETHTFINGVGYGIDGYCCQMGDEIKKNDKQEINYTGIAIKGLLFHYKPTNAKVTVDGVTKEYKKVWLAPTMFGHYYGGGMMPTPQQSRKDDTVSVMVYYGKGKLKSLIVFPSLFKGEHVKHTEMIDVRCGREITVEFDRPTPLQIDGETILGVTSYTAYCPSKANAMYAGEEAQAV